MEHFFGQLEMDSYNVWWQVVVDDDNTSDEFKLNKAVRGGALPPRAPPVCQCLALCQCPQRFRMSFWRGPSGDVGSP